MPLRELVAPACRLAIEGVTVSEYQAYLFGVTEVIFGASEACRSIFGSAGAPGKLVQAGERLANPMLADALEAIAIEGADLFYRGEIAASLVADMAAGGHLAAADLAGYRRREARAAVARLPRCANAHPTRRPRPVGRWWASVSPCSVRTPPVPGGSAPSDSGPKRRSAPRAHAGRLAAVMEVTAAARIEHSIEALAALDPASVERWREQVAGRTRAFRGTTHVSVIDAAGNVASATVSNGTGSGYVVPGTGIVMNNMLGEA